MYEVIVIHTSNFYCSDLPTKAIVSII